MKIYLIGLMGSGKSHIGKVLAQKLHWGFLDLDTAIEDAAGMTISDIFKQSGESAFREWERKILRKTEKLDHYVIATGGGCPCFFDNMDWILEQGLSVFLNPPISILRTRLKSEISHRPILAGKNDMELEETLISLLHKRLPYYQKAQLCIETSEEPSIINLILKNV